MKVGGSTQKIDGPIVKRDQLLFTLYYRKLLLESPFDPREYLKGKIGIRVN